MKPSIHMDVYLRTTTDTMKQTILEMTTMKPDKEKDILLHELDTFIYTTLSELYTFVQNNGKKKEKSSLKKEKSSLKKPLNPYLYFCKDMRSKVIETLNKENGIDITTSEGKIHDYKRRMPEVSRELSKQWKKLQDENKLRPLSKKGKQYMYYLELSRQDQERYQHEKKVDV